MFLLETTHRPSIPSNEFARERLQIENQRQKRLYDHRCDTEVLVECTCTYQRLKDSEHQTHYEGTLNQVDSR